MGLLTIFGFIFLVTIFILYSSFAWGTVMYHFWYWFLLPVFPTLPLISFWQAVGLSLFADLFKSRDLSIDKSSEDDSKEMQKLVAANIFPWLILLIGLFINMVIS